jgi:hypothetical protein
MVHAIFKFILFGISLTKNFTAGKQLKNLQPLIFPISPLFQSGKFSSRFETFSRQTSVPWL